LAFKVQTKTGLAFAKPVDGSTTNNVAFSGLAILIVFSQL
jgi:hypothetical protein